MGSRTTGFFPTVAAEENLFARDALEREDDCGGFPREIAREPLKYDARRLRKVMVIYNSSPKRCGPKDFSETQFWQGSSRAPSLNFL
jgi:hypothetical protein